jgi:hypothetical protein
MDQSFFEDAPANRVGKSVAGAYETTAPHLMGDYPLGAYTEDRKGYKKSDNSRFFCRSRSILNNGLVSALHRERP